MNSSNSRLPILASPRVCTGCMACVAVCPKKAIHQIIGSEGHTAVEINTEKCIHCRRCERMCEENKRNYGSNQLHESSVYCGWAQKEDFRKRGTSGGVFAAIAHTILKEHGIVFGASFDGIHCVHVAIERAEDIHLLQTSKYVQSSMINVYREIAEALPHRKVLFTGTGCQVAAVIEYFKDHQNKDNLYTIDLVCGGVPSGVLIEKYLKHNPTYDGIAAFRNKDRYELSVYREGSVVPIGEMALPLRGYAYGMTNRYCCYDCQFAHPHRISDITIGDLWNYNLYPEEHAKGISIMLTHTQRGEKLLVNSSIELKLASWKDILYTNPRIAYGRDRIFEPRKQLARNIEKLSYNEFDSLYCMKVKLWQVNKFLFKIYRHQCLYHQRKEARHYIDEILCQDS